MDLQSLKIDRGAGRAPKTRAAGPRRRLPLWPLALLALAGISWLLWPTLRPMVDRLRLPAVRTLLVTESTPAAAAAVAGTAANGYVVAARRAALSSDVPGRIVELRVTEGSVVKQGDIVARLYSDEWRAAMERARADVVAAEAALARAAVAQESAAAGEQEARATAEAQQARLAEARAQHLWAQQEHTRIEELVRQEIGAPQDLQRARSDLDAAAARVGAAEAALRSAEATVRSAGLRVQVASGDREVAMAQREMAAAAMRQAEAALDKMDVRAPFDGIVVLKDAEVGEVVSPNSQGGSNARGSVCTMVDFDSLEVQADVPETSLRSVVLGAPADVFLDAFPDQPYPGRVDRIWPTADRQKATIEVRVRLERRDQRLRPEMGVRVVFRREGEQRPAADAEPGAAAPPQILVPDAALVEIAGTWTAFRVERDVVQQTAVTIGERKGGQVVVTAGLRPGQRIVLNPPASLRDGDRVRIEENGT